MSGQDLIEKLNGEFGESILEMRLAHDDELYVRVDRDSVPRAADYLSKLVGARFLVSAGTDRRNGRQNLEVSHIFSLDRERLFVCLQCDVPHSDARIGSITPKVPAAGWSEREFNDVVGIEPVGHPDPRRLVLADNWPAGVYPLRKDFQFDEKPPAAEGMAPQMAAAPEGTTVLPIGPFYPVLEEPVHLRLFVNGEHVVGCDYRGFYNHRGIEKLGDSVLTYNQICFVAERICGICGFIHSCCYCQAVEKAAGIETPLRAKYIRSIMLELERVHSHLLWLGIAGHIIGFDTLLMQSWRIREPVMWLCEKITGNRKSYGMNLIGGVRRDIPAEIHPEILDVLAKIERETRALVSAIPGDSTLMVRLKDVGRLSNADAIKMAVVGPTARGSEVGIDSRADHPYAAYDQIDFKIPVYDECDVLARTLVRLDETFESIEMIRNLLKQMPDGPIKADIKEEIRAGLESMSVVEAPRGEAIHYVLTGDDNRPERWRVRAPTYANLQALPIMLANATIADVPITLGSIDPCFSCTERMEIADINSGEVKVYSQDDLLRLSKGGR